KQVAANLQRMSAVMVTLTGGEPLLRQDLEAIAASFDDRACLILNTTGSGLTPERARSLASAGVFAVGVSLDSADPADHDRLRGKPGAFQTALDGLAAAKQARLYPYIVAVATHDLLKPERFWPFLRFASEHGALEVHLLEPCATGRLAGHAEAVLSMEERELILDYQEQVAESDDLPILSSFTYLESPDAFGCGAGLTHLYIDGSGEVCPCNLVPISFGNVTQEPLAGVLGRMACHFVKPRTACVGRTLTRHVPGGRLPAPPEVSEAICANHLPRKHATPLFFQVRAESQDEVGRTDLQSAYDEIHDDYDEFWLKEAAKPIHDLIAQLSFKGDERVMEAGCGTGFATCLLAEKLKAAGRITAADISEGMLTLARQRARSRGIQNAQFVPDDALRVLDADGPFDLVFSSWVLGYILLKPFFASAGRALAPGGQLAFVVHKENSPRVPMEVFGELVAADPSVLLKRVAFDFPRDMAQIQREIASASLQVQRLWDGAAVFTYGTAEQVLEHLLKSGAGTAFYNALDPARRKGLEKEFLGRLADLNPPGAKFEVVHDYVACVARKP
ncbi:MAG: methyltransferase domain-containing protein, partial [Planctomycetes bacterium]|nr:methyltransferase domain-containing protein [Planctomycetota bacterium]